MPKSTSFKDFGVFLLYLFLVQKLTVPHRKQDKTFSDDLSFILHTNKICRNGFRMCVLLLERPFRRFFAKPRNLNVSLRLTALSLTLSHGERGQIGWKSQTWLGFGILNPLSHGEDGQNWLKSKNGWSSVSSIPSPRGRGLGRGQRTVRFAF